MNTPQYYVIRNFPLLFLIYALPLTPSCFARVLLCSKVYIFVEGINSYASSQNFVKFKDIYY